MQAGNLIRLGVMTQQRKAGVRFQLRSARAYLPAQSQGLLKIKLGL